MKTGITTMRHRTTGQEIIIADTPESRTDFFRSRDRADWQESPRAAAAPQPGDARHLTPGQRLER